MINVKVLGQEYAGMSEEQQKISMAEAKRAGWSLMGSGIREARGRGQEDHAGHPLVALKELWLFL